MMLLIFKIFLSAIELINLIVQVHSNLFKMVRDGLFPPKRKCIRHKIVVITGGAKGLGRELSLKLASLGAIVAIIDIDEVSLDAFGLRAIDLDRFTFLCRLDR
jgi:hypothetical protein